MRYVSTRGAWTDAPAAVLGDPARGPRARRRPRGAASATRALSGRAGGAASRLRYPRARARRAVALSTTDIPTADLKAIVDRTYTQATFGSDAITPVTTLEPGVHLLHASNGPTLAFKDIALQLLGNLFEYALAKRASTLNILGATSGDTGSSAEYAMRGKRGIDVFMLSPKDRMSPFQHGADVLARRRQHPQHRDRRRVRRVPGHRQGGRPPTPRSRRATGSARSIRSTGRASPRRSSTTSAAISP